MDLMIYDSNNRQPVDLVYPSNTGGCKNVLLIDNSTKDANLFASSVNSSTFPIIYASSSTKTELLALLRSTFTTIDRIGLVFASNVGSSNTFLDGKPFFTQEESSSSPYSENVEFLIAVLKEFNVKNIDYLACNTLNYPNWVHYYTLLTKETGVVIGASNDQTGNIKYGGNWLLESTSENIELVYFTKSIEYYRYLLDAQGYTLIVFKEDATIWGTGYNFYGQLGLGDTADRARLTQMATTMIEGRTPRYISCGAFHTIVLMTDKTIWGTGSNSYGQLGLGNKDDQPRLTRMVTTMIEGRTPQYISGGTFHTIVLMTDKTIWGTGDNFFGQLGLGSYTADKTSLTPMVTTMIGDRTPQYISCGQYHTIVLMTDKTIWGTGANTYGQLGLGNKDDQPRLTPMVTSMIEGRIPQYISCGAQHTIVLMTDKTIWGTGDNFYGQLGLGNKDDQPRLTRMDTSTIGDRIPQYISCGQFNSYVLMTDKTIWGTGYNFYGQLGLGNKDYQPRLTQIGDINNNNNIISIMGMFMDNHISSDICFPSGTPIKTDQGVIAIEKINPDIHTIRKKPIVDITKTITLDKYLVKFKKNALGINYPNKNTLMSKEHMILYKGKLSKAKTFLGNFEKVVRVKYNGEILYNVLMEEHSLIHVNNLLCETLHPENIIAKLFTKKCKYSHDMRDKIVVALNNCKQKNDYETYNKILQLC